MTVKTVQTVKTTAQKNPKEHSKKDLKQISKEIPKEGGGELQKNRETIIQTPLHTGVKVIVRKGINGLGLFAGEAVKNGAFIIEYWGEVLTEAQADGRGGKYLFQTGKDRHIDGTRRENTARYVNHSCVPNCEVKIKKGRICIYAIKNIKEGEEFFYDYGEEYWEAYIKPKGCRCAKCVKKAMKGGVK